MAAATAGCPAFFMTLSNPNDNTLVTQLNNKYNSTVIFPNDSTEAEEIVKDLLTPILPDNSSGLTVVSLLHLSPNDIDNLCLSQPELTRAVLYDLSTLNRRVCRQLVESIKEKMKMDGDAFRLEHILRKTVADLESRKKLLEVSLLEEKAELQELRDQANMQREENLRLQLKLKQAKEHLIGAGVFDSNEISLSERINTHNKLNICTMDQRLASNIVTGAAPLSLGSRRERRPDWRY